MRYTQQIDISWSGRLIETYQLPMDRGKKKKNLIATDYLLSNLGKYEQNNNNYLWRNISPEIICDYFTKFNVADGLKKVNLDLICTYIRDLIKEKELTSWSVVLMNKDKTTVRHKFSNGITVGCFDRNRADDTDKNTYYIRKNHIVGHQQDEFIDLDETLLNDALKRTLQYKKDNGQIWNKNYPAPEIVRQEFRPPTSPLLLIYPLNPICANVKDLQENIIADTITFNQEDEPFIGFAISFPNSKSRIAISYRVNQVAEFAETEDMFDATNDNIYDEQ